MVFHVSQDFIGADYYSTGRLECPLATQGHQNQIRQKSSKLGQESLDAYINTAVVPVYTDADGVHGFPETATGFLCHKSF